MRFMTSAVFALCGSITMSLDIDLKFIESLFAKAVTRIRTIIFGGQIDQNELDLLSELSYYMNIIRYI